MSAFHTAATTTLVPYNLTACRSVKAMTAASQSAALLVCVVRLWCVKGKKLRVTCARKMQSVCLDRALLMKA